MSNIEITRREKKFTCWMPQLVQSKNFVFDQQVFLPNFVYSLQTMFVSRYRTKLAFETTFGRPNTEIYFLPTSRHYKAMISSPNRIQFIILGIRKRWILSFPPVLYLKIQVMARGVYEWGQRDEKWWWWWQRQWVEAQKARFVLGTQLIPCSLLYNSFIHSFIIYLSSDAPFSSICTPLTKFTSCLVTLTTPRDPFWLRFTYSNPWVFLLVMYRYYLAKLCLALFHCTSQSLKTPLGQISLIWQLFSHGPQRHQQKNHQRRASTVPGNGLRLVSVLEWSLSFCLLLSWFGGELP